MLAGVTIAVTGGGGYLGTALVRKLVSSTSVHSVVAIDVAEPRAHVVDQRVSYVSADVRDAEQLRVVLEEFQVTLVFHCCAVIDLCPVMPDLLYDVNVNGTKNVIQACTNAPTVQALVHTSSIDVTFTGNNVIRGTEAALPYSSCPAQYNGYIHSKVLAERAVLAANCPELRTAALRPSHIYGPGDAMLTIVSDLVRSGGAPYRIGHGVNDYVFVDNVAAGHILCAESLLMDANSLVPGRAFFLSDLHANIWDFVEPFLEAQGLQPPAQTLPMWIGVGAGWVADWIQTIYFFSTSRTLPSLQPTRYGVLSTSLHLTYDASAAKEAFGFGDPRICTSRSEAAKATTKWLVGGGRQKFYGDSGTVNEHTAALHTLHWHYGGIYVMLGAFLFLAPMQGSTAFASPTTKAPGPLGKMIIQTAGLILAVLGAYSVAAAEGRWSVLYFRMTYYPRILSALLFGLLVWTHKLPASFLLFTVVEAIVAALTFRLLKQAKRSGVHFGALSLRFDRIAVAQALHAVLSGMFQMFMLFRPRSALTILLSMDPADVDEEAVRWGHVMGALEIFMTWTYAASAVVHGLEPFVRLSVVSRLGAVAVLGVGYLCEVSTLKQFLGVIGDGLLAIVTVWALASLNRLERPIGAAPQEIRWKCSL